MTYKTDKRGREMFEREQGTNVLRRLESYTETREKKR